MSVVSVYAVFKDMEEAERIGRLAVETGVAACVNILGPCTSIYRWQGKVETSSEVAAIFKTGSSAAGRLVAHISELHSYEVPAIAVWPIEKLPAPYAAWVEECTGEIGKVS